MKVGRQAAWTITQSCPMPGKLAIFVGGNRWHGHDLREVGFRAFARDRAPAFAVLDTLVTLETRPLTYEATLDLLTRHADLRGFAQCRVVAGIDGWLQALRVATVAQSVKTRILRFQSVS